MENTVLPRPVKKRSKNYFKIHVKLLKYCGISFTGNEMMAYKLYSFLILSSSVYAYTVLAIYELFQHDAQTNSSFLNYLSAFIIAMIKVSIMVPNRIKIGNLLAKLEQKPFLPNRKRGGDEEEKLIQECTWKVNMQSYIIWFATAATSFASCMYAASTRLSSNNYRDWKFPYVPVTHMNVTYSLNYEIALLYQCFAGLVGVVYYVTVDLIIAAVLIHISCQFKILQNFLKRIVEHSYEEMLKDTGNIPSTTVLRSEIDGSIIPYKYLQKSLKKAVRHHLAILDIAKEVEEVFCYLLMLTFLVTLTYLSFQIFQLLWMVQTFSHDTAVVLLRRIVEVLDCIFTVTILCYWGEQVMFESQQVGDAAYQANFVGTDVRFQKSLMLIMRRSQEPTKLTAGKFTNICLATFVWIMKTSYSTFMLLRNLQEKEM